MQRVKGLSHTGSLQAQNFREVTERLAATAHNISHPVDSLAEESQSTQQADDMIGATADQTGVGNIVDTQQALDDTSQAITGIHEMGQHMAAASDQQANAADDNCQQIINIVRVSDQNAELAKHSAQISEDMQATAQALNAPIERFNR